MLTRGVLTRGVLTRGAVAAERVPGGFAAVYPVLRALEETGRWQAGLFRRGSGRGAQFALPGAVDRMRTMRDPLKPAGYAGVSRGLRALVLAAADPANPYGAALLCPARPGETAGAHKPGRKAGALVVLADGRLVLYVELLYVERGAAPCCRGVKDPDVLGPATLALAHAVREGALGRLTVERPTAPVFTSPRLRTHCGMLGSTQLHGAFAFESNCRTTEPHNGAAR